MSVNRDHSQRSPKPPWLKRPIPSGATCHQIQNLLNKSQLHTVCQEARCPNLGECFSHGTATFLILGDRCTRNCGFCAVAHGPLAPPDPEEPARMAEAVKGIRLATSLIPVGLMVVGLIILIFFPINREREQEISQFIKAKQVAAQDSKDLIPEDTDRENGEE